MILIVAAVLTWLVTNLGAMLFYAYFLVHPGCPDGPAVREGFQPVVFATADGLQLRGWWRAPQNGVVILLVPGHGGGRDSLLSEGEVLARRGYGLLAIDLRQCAGQPATFGFREVEDVRGAVAFALAQPGVNQVGALGFSSGGAAVIQAAAQIPDLHAVAAMGGFADLQQHLGAQVGPPLSPAWMVQNLLPGFIEWQMGVPPREVSPLKQIAGISPRAVLLVYGKEESALPQGLAQYAAARSPKALWVVPGANHGGYLAADPQGFWANQVGGFFDEYLLSSRST